MIHRLIEFVLAGLSQDLQDHPFKAGTPLAKPLSMFICWSYRKTTMKEGQIVVFHWRKVQN